MFTIKKCICCFSVLGQLEITHIAGYSMLSRYHKTVFVWRYLFFTIKKKKMNSTLRVCKLGLKHLGSRCQVKCVKQRVWNTWTFATKHRLLSERWLKITNWESATSVLLVTMPYFCINSGILWMSLIFFWE